MLHLARRILMIGFGSLLGFPAIADNENPNPPSSYLEVLATQLPIALGLGSKITRFEVVAYADLAPNDRSPQLTIKTNYKQATIKVGDQKFLYETSFDTLRPGQYTLEISLEGYATIFRELIIAQNYRYRIEVELNRNQGQLVLPDEGDWTVDREPAQGTIAVATGVHQVRARRFGFADAVLNLRVDANARLEIIPHLIALPWRLSLTEPSQRTLSPYNAGALGTVTLGFTVSGPGTVTLTIKNADQVVIYSNSFPALDRAETLVRWNGRDHEGRVLPEGVYRWEITGRASDSAPEEAAVGQPLTISYNRYSKPRSQFSGVSGTPLAADTFTLASGTLQTGLDLLAGLPQFTTSPTLTTLGLVGLRIGVLNNLELTASGRWGLDWGNQAGSLASLVAGAKWAFLPPSEQSFFSLGLTLRGAWTLGLKTDQIIPSFDTTYNGYQIGLPIQLALTRLPVILALNLEPCLVISPWATLSDTLGATARVHSYLVGRVGLTLDADQWLANLSLAIASIDLSGTTTATQPIKLAAEIRLNPSEGLTTSLIGGIDLSSGQATAWGGLTLGLTIN